ncbi:uncharacterized protein LOC107644234 isoform X2 [Arachis ipaensis]|uniref:uncharacterized protein LOC107644234 isoform X2 n=1 Tax=Arachis ipaensis TaxID=130454 RepID=UPI000A2AFF24|nr:uncharacterized protein LOC107644234 isoform X2 [Arachis ipaensis]XP_025655810.1 uncharacterized protein LOC112751042 isoform X2 [Arachis hypogaea]
MRQRHMWWWCRTEAGTTPPPWRRCEAMKASEKKSLKRTELERLEQIVELYLQQRNLHSLNIYGRHLTTQGIDDILYAYSSGLSAKIARNIIGEPGFRRRRSSPFGNKLILPELQMLNEKCNLERQFSELRMVYEAFKIQIKRKHFVTISVYRLIRVKGSSSEILSLLET